MQPIFKALLLVLLFSVLPTSATSYSNDDPCNEGFVAPVVQFKARAPYSKTAKINHIEGTVTVSVLVGIDGKVGDILVVDGGHQSLIRSAIGASKLCRFEPGRDNCIPLEAWTTLEYSFYLPKPEIAVPPNEQPIKPEIKEPCNEQPIKPEMITKSKAQYPEMARDSQIAGTVIVRVLVGIDGSVKNVVVDQGVHPLLNRSAIDAARKCRFEPGRENCEPTKSWTKISYSFSVD